MDRLMVETHSLQQLPSPHSTSFWMKSFHKTQQSWDPTCLRSSNRSLKARLSKKLEEKGSLLGLNSKKQNRPLYFRRFSSKMVWSPNRLNTTLSDFLRLWSLPKSRCKKQSRFLKNHGLSTERSNDISIISK